MRLGRLVFAVGIGIGGVTAAGAARADVLEVGPGKAYATPCAALRVAVDGDTVAIDAAVPAGTYDGDVCAFGADRLTIRGVGGRAAIDAAGQASQGKAIWVIQGDDTVVEDVELSGCSVPDQNGAGIRQEGANLTLRRVVLRDNENGLLSGANAASTIVIEDSELARNGAGDGYSHNVYIGEVKRFELRGSWSHHARVGHLVKSRAHENVILYNRLTDEDGTASYEIDLPQGGASLVLGNVVQQSATSENSAFISFAREATRNPDSALVVASNTFYNARGAGTFVAAAADLAGAVTLRNNVFAGPGTIADPAVAIVAGDGNWVGDPGFVDVTNWDFHLLDGSSARDAGVAPGSVAGVSLVPACQYVHPAHAVVRVANGGLDPGAFEVGGEGAEPCGEGPVVVEEAAPVETVEVVESVVVEEGADVDVDVDARGEGGAEEGAGVEEVVGAEEGAGEDVAPVVRTGGSDGCAGGAPAWGLGALVVVLGARRRALRTPR